MDLGLNHFCWNLNANMALSIIISDLGNSRVQLELTFPSTFALIFKRSKPCYFQLTNISCNSPYFIPLIRTNIYALLNQFAQYNSPKMALLNISSSVLRQRK